MHLLQGGERPTDVAENALGWNVVGPTGKVTGGLVSVYRPTFGFAIEEITGGSVAVDAQGVITGTVVTCGEAGSPTSTTFSGVMATDRMLVAGALRTVDGERTGSGLTLLQRQADPGFATPDLAGTWQLSSVVLHPATAEQSTWVRGTLAIDHTQTSTLVTFPPGLKHRTVRVPILDNRLVQGTRTVMLGLDEPTGGARLGDRASAVLTIPEDDQGGRSCALAVAARPWWSTGRSSAAPRRRPSPPWLTFAPRETSKTVTITVGQIDSGGADLTAVLGLSVAPGAATIGARSTSTLTILGPGASAQGSALTPAR